MAFLSTSTRASARSSAEDAFIAPTATIIGDVTIEAGASVWYGAVLRGDDGPIVVREHANVQDGSVHPHHAGRDDRDRRRRDRRPPVHVHGAVLEEEALVGNGCVVLDGARIGAGSLVAALSLVQPGVQIPPGVLAAGVPAVVQAADRGHAGRDVGEDEPDRTTPHSPSAHRGHPPDQPEKSTARWLSS